MFRALLLTLVFGLMCNLANAQTFYSWRQQKSSSNCQGLTGGTADLCYQQTNPALFVCDNNGGACTQSSQWVLVTPMYLSGGIVYTYNNYPLQIGTSGIGSITGSTAINMVVGVTTQFTINASGISAPGSIGSSTTGTNFVCVNTSGTFVKSTSACSGT